MITGGSGTRPVTWRWGDIDQKKESAMNALRVPLHCLAFGLALASVAASAQAQNVISRQVTQEPVETTVIEGPSGAVVTRRPLAPAVGTIAVQPGVAPAYDPYAAPAPL